MSLAFEHIDKVASACRLVYLKHDS